MIKGLILQENVTILNVYVSNRRVSKYMRQKLIELQEVDKSAIIAGEFKTPVSIINKSTRQKISNDIAKPNSTINN